MSLPVTYEEYPLPWHVQYDNDVGPDDDGFWEWWGVIAANGETVCRCDSEVVANAIVAALGSAP